MLAAPDSIMDVNTPKSITEYMRVGGQPQVPKSINQVILLYFFTFF